ncbi:MAG: PEP-CTERM sorting domain-containing protein [Bryobacteraceae bacterium]
MRSLKRSLNFMVKQSFGFMLLATLLVVSSSVVRADTYSIVSNWQIGYAQFGDLETITGDGTFTWDGTTFSDIVFSFVETSPASSTIWTATSDDGELLASNEFLIVGNGPFDCAGPSCVGIFFASPVTTGSPLTLAGTSGFTQFPNTIFDSATLTDTSYSSSVPEPSSVVLLLTVLVAAGLVVGKRLRRVAPAIES